MYIILLKFSDNRSKAPEHMQGHKAWITKGMDSGYFLVVGSLQPSAGGAIIALGKDMATVEAMVKEDPFVAENIVTAEILEITPNMVDDRLAFLLSGKESEK